MKRPGRFTTKLNLRDHVANEWVLTQSLIYYSSDDFCRVVAVPRGFITDLASIPAPLRGILNPNGNSRKAAVLHDYLYCSRLYSRAESDALFREALEVCGVDWATRWAMWAGVRAGGWIYYNKRKGLPLGADDFMPEADI